MRIEIPGYKTMDLKYLILDYNGTIAKDGIIPESVKERLKKLSGIYEIYVLTADTHGTARKICEGLPLKIQTFPGNAAAEEKREAQGPVDPAPALQKGRETWSRGNFLISCTCWSVSNAIPATPGPPRAAMRR